MLKFHRKNFTGCLLTIWLALPLSARAQLTTVPGPADAARIFQPVETRFDHSHDGEVVIPHFGTQINAPESAKNVRFMLHAVDIEGVHVFSAANLRDSYATSLNKEVTLDLAWRIAANVTERYRNAGYFLTRAYVPEQEIKDGVIIIRVVEGYIGRVDLTDKRLANNYIVNDLAKRLRALHPLTTTALESFLLRLNDLPGLSFRAVLSPLPEPAEEGAVLLTLVPSRASGAGSISVDNYGSRFLGPEEAAASYQISLLPLESTTVSLSSSLPWHELRYGSLSHSIILLPDVTLQLDGNWTKAHPGDTLKQFDIDSNSKVLSASLTYQWLRQRNENLAFSLGFDGRNTITDLLDTPFTRDRIRAVRATMLYDKTDHWAGYNNVNFTFSHGLRILNASEKGDLDVSRAGAVPDFNKATLNLSRQQGIGANFSLLAAATGQWSANTLYSAEQFGYGGQVFGRAFDASEITGDDGLDGSLELRYDTLLMPAGFQVTPYGFYDIGAVWNKDFTSTSRESGSSTGFGLRLNTRVGLSADGTMAFPLTRPEMNPIYGGSSHTPRLSLRISYGF